MDRIETYTTVPRFSLTRALVPLLRWALRYDAAHRNAVHADHLFTHLRKDIGLGPKTSLPTRTLW